MTSLAFHASLRLLGAALVVAAFVLREKRKIDGGGQSSLGACATPPAGDGGREVAVRSSVAPPAVLPDDTAEACKRLWGDD